MFFRKRSLLNEPTIHRKPDLLSFWRKLLRNYIGTRRHHHGASNDMKEPLNGEGNGHKWAFLKAWGLLCMIKKTKSFLGNLQRALSLRFLMKLQRKSIQSETDYRRLLSKPGN